jgi:hypothetical protein
MTAPVAQRRLANLKAKTKTKTKVKTEYVRVDLRVEHPSITSNEISQALGLVPDCTGMKGEPRDGRGPRPASAPGHRRALWPFHYAGFSFGEGEGREQLDAALRLIEARAAEIASLTNSGGCVTVNVFAAPSFGWGVVIRAAELNLLARAGVELGLDVHRETEDHFRRNIGESE